MPTGGSSTDGAIGLDARMIVVEYEHAGIGVDSSRPRHARCPDRGSIRARTREARAGVADGFARPRAIVAVRRHDDPFAPQRMPSFFPSHGSNLRASRETNRDNDRAGLALSNRNEEDGRGVPHARTDWLEHFDDRLWRVGDRRRRLGQDGRRRVDARAARGDRISA